MYFMYVEGVKKKCIVRKEILHYNNIIMYKGLTID